MEINSKIEEYEPLKAKIRKLAALAERGVGGEAKNARILMERICRKYGVSLDEMLNLEDRRWYGFEVGCRKIDFRLFCQCYTTVTGKRTLTFRRRSRSRISVELTGYEYAEISSLFKWHKKNFKKDIENFTESLFIAYISKHSLGPERTDKEEMSLSPEDISRIMAAIALEGQLNDNTYRKQIGY